MAVIAAVAHRQCVASHFCPQSHYIRRSKVAQSERRFTDDQIKVLLNGYCQGLLKGAEVQEILGIGKTRFFALINAYRNAPETFSVGYEGRTSGRLPTAVEVKTE